nr:hypothetical protein BaRGS_021028 [Batillaria attramentaria]
MTLRKIGKWIKKNPKAALAIAGAIGKRQTPSEDAVKEALAEACEDFPEDAAPTDLVVQAFMEADVNGDGQLSEEEAAEFAKMLAALILQLDAILARRTLRKVGKWVKKNPQAPVAIGKATLSLGKRQTPSDDAVMEALAEACGDFPEDAAPTDAVTEAFMEADVNGDGQLSEEEAAEFAKMLVFE